MFVDNCKTQLLFVMFNNRNIIGSKLFFLIEMFI